MSWSDAIFQVVIQPNLNKTLQHIGTKIQNVILDDNQTAGVVLMAYNIFGPDYINHIRLYLSTGFKATVYEYESEPILLVPASLLYSASDYYFRFIILAVSGIYDVDPNETWYEYINRLGTIRGYSANEVIMPYTCRMINRDSNTTYIFQFLTPAFIDGIVTLCRWFSLDTNLYLDNVHMGTILQQVNIV